MQKFRHIIISLLLMLIALAPLNALPDEVTEKVYLSCDRSVYIAGESIAFFAHLTSVNNQQLSKVLYVELLDASGKQIEGIKTPVDDFTSSGQLVVPADLLSGYYYLRAYTKWMRNQGPESYAWKLIKVINPTRNETMTGTDTLEPQNLTESETFIIQLQKKEIKTRENVVFEVDMIRNNLDVVSFSFSVVPEEAVQSLLWQPVFSDSISTTIYHMPETKGISLSGQLVDEETGEGVPSQHINLTVVDQNKEFMARQTDENGRFFFALPDGIGERDLFICAQHATDKKTVVRVDKDFCSIEVKLPAFYFELDSVARASTLKMAVNHQVNGFFPVSGKTELLPISPDERAFYGKPTHVVDIDRYVQLPTLEEYFNELPGMARVRKRNGSRYFKVLGTNGALAIYDPLVMIDLVAIDDPEKVLSVAPQQIERIEIVNEPYIKGDLTYGGIISLISRKGDFGGIDLPSSGIFVAYELFDPAIKQQKVSNSNADNPDPRNTIGWWPNVTLNPKKKISLSFKTGDTSGNFAIVATAILSNGEIEYAVKRFNIKD